MRQAGRRYPGFERSRAIGKVMLLLVPTLAWSCGGSSQKSRGEATAGTGASSPAGSNAGGSAGAAAGGKAGVGGSGAGMGTSGASPMGGAEPFGGAGAGGSSVAGDGGAGGAPNPLLGVECDDATCAIGQACILCLIQGVSKRSCVPHPQHDPAGYAEATEVCDPEASGIFNDCDGPEDCEPDQYCVAQEGPDGFFRCRDMPSTQHSCCFACGASTDCTICRGDQDCPDGETCSPAMAAPGVMGCH